MNPKFLTCYIALYFVFCLSIQAQTASLQIIDLSDSSSTVEITAGQSFTAEILAADLPTPLDSFNLTFSTLPTGLTLTGFTDTIPSGWQAFSSVPNLEYGGVNFSGSDITPSGELVWANFTSSSTMAPGDDIVTFTPPGLLQNLNDSNGDPIDYTLQSLNVDVSSPAVPEPSTWILFGFSAIALRILRRFCSCAVT